MTTKRLGDMVLVGWERWSKLARPSSACTSQCVVFGLGGRRYTGTVADTKPPEQNPDANIKFNELGQIPVDPSDGTEEVDETGEPFRKLQILAPAKETVKRYKRPPQRQNYEQLPPRWTRMKPDMDWTAVWPTAMSFKESVVPIPVRMGYQKKKPMRTKVPPAKYGNLELMKIPNFLHLTPAAIKKHCDALKKFCTPWPEALKDRKTQEKHFPITFSHSDYVHSGPNIRDPRARIVSFQLKLSSLDLDYHARDKMIRLLGSHYDHKSDIFNITVDRCPTRQQNTDYIHYVLTALYHEAWKVEEWEKEKTEADMERYFWRGSKSESLIVQSIQTLWNHYTSAMNAAQDEAKQKEVRSRYPSYIWDLQSDSEEEILQLDVVKKYADTCENLRNAEIETRDNVREYGSSVRNAYGLPPQLIPKTRFEVIDERRQRLSLRKPSHSMETLGEDDDANENNFFGVPSPENDTEDDTNIAYASKTSDPLSQ